VSVWQDKHVPWDGPGEWLVWLVVLVIATFLIHNTIRTYKEKR
jgi:hypothetical protein